MAFTTSGFQPVSVEYLKVGQKYTVRIRDVRPVQVAENGAVVDKLVIDFDVKNVRSPRPSSMNFKSRPLTNEKNAQTKWDEKWTRFKEIFGIPLGDENYNGWVGKVGILEVGSFRDTPFFQLTKKEEGAVQQQQAHFEPVPQMQNAQQASNLNTFPEDIPF